MEIEEMKISDVIDSELFFNKLHSTLQELKRKRNDALRFRPELTKRGPIDTLSERGVLDTKSFKNAYKQVMNKEATEYSSTERRFITTVGNFCFDQVMRKIIERRNDEKQRNHSNGDN